MQRLENMHEDSTEGEETKRQQGMKIMQDMTKKIGSNGRMDGENRRWVAELLAADCEKAWLHVGWEYTMQEWYDWLEEMEKKDERKKLEALHQQKVNQMMKSAESSAGLLHKITKPTAWRRGAQILEKQRIPGCWTAEKQRRKNGQSIGDVTKACRKWKTSLGK